MTTPVGAPAVTEAQTAAPAACHVQAINLWKTFGPLAALRGVTLGVGAGQRLAVLGPNGSGKSTLLKVLATLLRPSAGTARLAGLDVRTHSAQVRCLIGVVCHQTFLYMELTAAENLEFYGRLYGVPDARDRAHQLLRLVGMERQAGVQLRDLSRGMQQRVALARAMVHDPQILLLDEPDTGLDQRWSGFLVDLLGEAARRGRSVIVSTHNLERSLDFGDRLAVLNAGRLVFTAKRGDLDVGSLRESYFQHTGAAH
ncbi:MAG: ABC transporter ATP-binding protein [Chloroflexi bacterium]|nr:ABC transporter ATP-binding protein [Chloroflexota bacterium]